jgi:hypothetical protein
MARKSPITETIRALFARSGNRCAFPGCTQVLINRKNQFVAQICHIRAAEPGGERYEPSMTDEQRRSYGNLILLCYPHHVETDDVIEFPVERLEAIKAEHERAFADSLFELDEHRLLMITQEFERTWDRLKALAETQQRNRELAMEVYLDEGYFELFDNIWLAISRNSQLNDSFRDYENKLPGDVQRYLENKYLISFMMSGT